MAEKSSGFSEIRESEKSLSMNWGHFKYFLSCPYLAGSVGSSWSLTQEVASSITFFFLQKSVQEKHFSRTQLILLNFVVSRCFPSSVERV